MNYIAEHISDPWHSGYNDVSLHASMDDDIEVAVAAWEWGTYLGADALKNEWMFAYHRGIETHPIQYLLWQKHLGIIYRDISCN